MTMRCLSFVKTGALIVLVILAGAGMAAERNNPLLQEQWKTRPLIVLASSTSDRVLNQLVTALQAPRNREAFIEREMVLYTVVGNQGQRNGQSLTPAQTMALVQALDVRLQGQTTIVLVGKDGGKKIVQQGYVDPADIFATIDKMPMRQR
jgi:hypothetical protein